MKAADASLHIFKNSSRIMKLKNQSIPTVALDIVHIALDSHQPS